MANSYSYGVDYQRKQAEYQFFPEEYFSGSDVTLYFDDVYMEDIQNLEFGLQEKVIPVYGYNSYTYDAVARGQRIIQGSFVMLFKEAGYMSSIMSHIGSLKGNAKPALAYHLGGQGRPKWVAGAQETIEDLLNRQAGIKTDSVTTEQVPKWANMSLGSSGSHVTAFTTWLSKQRGSTRYKGIYLIGSGGFSTSKTYKYGSRSSDLLAIKKRLNTYLYDSGKRYISKKLNTASSSYDSAMVSAVKSFQRNFSKSLAADGILGPKTLSVLNRAFSVRKTIEAPEKLAIMRFQQANGLTVDGIAGPKVRAKIRITVKVSTSTLKKGAEGDFASYEASIWGEQSTKDPIYKSKPHFYGARGQEWLLQDGFDIYINYGQLPTDLAANNKTGELVSYSNTVRAIRGVQLTGLQQVLSPTGEAIGERYSFIAKDLD